MAVQKKIGTADSISGAGIFPFLPLRLSFYKS